MKILGIETSCDETAAAIVTDQGEILSDLVLSQLKDHAVYGGVVPEIAARAHLDHLHKLIEGALRDAKLSFRDLDGVAATCGPGLIGGVMIGMMAGKAIAASQDIPFLAVNHLEGHALTPRLSDGVEFPYLLLLISGGHSQILVVEGAGQYRRLGTTLDDAAGECFDKAAKLMGLPYPGGPHVEKIAALCEDQDAALKRFDLPRPMKGRKGCDLSFSGLKTAIRNHVQKLPEGDLQKDDIAALSYAFQVAMADVLKDRLAHAIEIFKSEYQSDAPTLVVSGGVAANQMIRSALQDLAKDHGMILSAPPLKLCGDNAVMIAWAGIEKLRLGQHDGLDFKARPRWPLDPHAEARHGGGVKA